MNVTLDYLRSRRIWTVNGFSVWGEYSSVSLIFLMSEIGSGSSRILFVRETLGGMEQVVDFDQLTDQKGNQLPSTISNPKVIPLQKNDVTCLIVGQESQTGFKIAKLDQTPTPGVVDLLIVENA
ncbi:MAG: hypothetical protein L0Y74_03590 [candidate division Zixibacteria bacterium]|nr:hypothetical protein [candidate division Zixibacteria bacterium]